MEARLDRDHLAFDRWCTHFSRRMAIRAVQIWMRRAFSLVPTKLFTLRFCFNALKNSCRVRDWRGADLAPFQPLPIRTAREVFPQAAHPASFVGRVRRPAVRRPLSREAL